MDKFVDKKVVSIDYAGPILPLGGIYGPTIPQIMDVSDIATLIIKQYPVTEHLNDGTKKELDIANYNIDFNGDDGASVKGKSGKPNNTPENVPTEEQKKKAKEEEEKKAEEARIMAELEAEEAAKRVTTSTIADDKNDKKNKNWKNDKKDNSKSKADTIEEV
jgi:hypothetical protein